MSPGSERTQDLDALPPAGERLFAGLVRRLSRLGLDLHDGVLQELAALRAEIDLLSSQLDAALAEHEHRTVLIGRIGDLTARVDAIAGGLRDLAASLQPRVVAVDGIRAALEAEIHSICRTEELSAHLDLDGPLDELDATARETLVHFVREALRNTRRHSGATEVSVRVFGREDALVAEVTDNGRGFAVAVALERAARAGRLGLVGISEQLRLAGGELEVASRPGGPTVVRATLPVALRGEPGQAPARVGSGTASAAPRSGPSSSSRRGTLDQGRVSHGGDPGTITDQGSRDRAERRSAA